MGCRGKGIDITKAQSKGFDQLSVKNFDFVITMGCKDKCPFVPAQEYLDWKLEDPKGKGIEFFRKTRDMILSNIHDLIKKISDEN